MNIGIVVNFLSHNFNWFSLALYCYKPLNFNCHLLLFWLSLSHYFDRVSSYYSPVRYDVKIGADYFYCLFCGV